MTNEIKIGDEIWYNGCTGIFAAIITDIRNETSICYVDGVKSKKETTYVCLDYCAGRRWYDNILYKQGYMACINDFGGKFLGKPVFHLMKKEIWDTNNLKIFSSHQELRECLAAA